MAVLGDDELGRQGKDRLLSRRHQNRRYGEMPVEGCSIRLAGLVAGRTGDFLRLEKVQAVEGHEEGVPDRAEGVQKSFLKSRLSQREEERGDRPGRDGIQQGADLVVGRDPMDPEEGAGVVIPSFRVHLSLVLEKGGRLDEENPKGRKGGVLDLVVPVVAGLSGVGKGGEDGADRLDQRVHGQGSHGAGSSGRNCPSVSRKRGARGRRKTSLVGRAH